MLLTEGLRSFWAKLLGHLFYRRLVVVANDMTVPPPDVQPKVEVTVREVTEDDIGAYVAFGPKADAETVRRRLAAGSRIHAAWFGDRIVCASWTDFDNASFDAIGAAVPIAPTDVYGRDVYTLPEFRRKRIASYRFVTAMRLLREEGYERALGYVLPENRRGFGPTAKANVNPIGSVGWFGIGPFRIYFFKKTGSDTRFLPRFRRGRKPVVLDLDFS